MKDWPIVPLSFDTTVPEFACHPLPDDTGDLSQVITLVQRGDYCYETQQSNLEAFGARYIMFYNTHERTEEPWSFYQDNSILSLIEAEAGEAITNTVKAGGNVTADFSINPNTNYCGIHNSAGGRPSTFTSWGGLYDLTLKPDLAAPGGRILNTYLRNNHAVMSGTSMACLYVAGFAALYVGQCVGPRSLHPWRWCQMSAFLRGHSLFNLTRQERRSEESPSFESLLYPQCRTKCRVSFRYPNYRQGLDSLSVYSGKVLITSGKGEHFGVSYFGRFKFAL